MGTTTDVIRGRSEVTFNAVNLGYVDGDIQFTYNPVFGVWTPGQETAPTNIFLEAESCQIVIPMAEHNLTKLQYAYTAGAYVLDGSGVKKKITVGGATSLSSAQELIVTPIEETNDNELLTIYKAVCTSPITDIFSKTANRTTNVTFIGLVDTTKSAGNKLFCIGDTTATA